MAFSISWLVKGDTLLREPFKKNETMDHHIFLSYATLDEDLIENFADHLRRNGVKAWVYSIDKTLSIEIWSEIERRIDEAELFAFAASVYTRGAKGQHRELERVIQKIQQCSAGSQLRLLPIVIRGLSFNELPTALRRINGIRLDAYNVKSAAFNVAKTFFPDLFDDAIEKPWKVPRPGQWLEVCNIGPGIENYLSLNSLLYFRRISPLGLFECYSPQLDELFWILPENVRACRISQSEYPDVPKRFRYETSLEHEIRGRKSEQQ